MSFSKDSQSEKRTSSIPSADWSIDNYQNKEKTSLENGAGTGSGSSLQLPESSQCSLASNRVPVINSALGNSDNVTNINVAPNSIVSATPFASTSQSRIVGDVSLTPIPSSFTPQTVNPHSSMTALTPMASGTSQAKSSIKVQITTVVKVKENIESTVLCLSEDDLAQALGQAPAIAKTLLRNCVSTVHLGCELKLLDIYCRTRFSEYNPARFQGVVMKIIDPRATALVFRSGKVLCTGVRNEHDSYIAARKFARIIQKLGFPAKFLDFKIQNFIATADLRFPIRLEALQQAHGQFASYEPELFPGLVYRMVRPRVVLLIFVNGKIVFTGGKTRNEIGEALDIIYPILRSYRIS